MPNYEHGPDYDFEALARKLGQNDPTEWRWKLGANDNGRSGPLSARRRSTFCFSADGFALPHAILCVVRR